MSGSPSNPQARFEHFLRWRCAPDHADPGSGAAPGIELDFALSGLAETVVEARRGGLQRALAAMAELEGGAVANSDEGRMVGHYWLRAPDRAPNQEIAAAIEASVEEVCAFAGAVHDGGIAPPEASHFRHVLVIGIGGSALGPMLVADVFADVGSKMTVTVLDNTDPDGIDRTLARLGSLREVLVVVISKSGGTPEPRNCLLEVERACEAEGLELPRRAVAITQDGSALHQRAMAQEWIATFPMWDWVGGRTSQLSTVGLLPAALQGLDVRGLLAGAAAMDAWTREPDPRHNPAALLALLWEVEGGGRGDRAMVVLPYKDRLLLISRYLQQLVMESLGKAKDRRGNAVHQGLVVYGNKGSTDQHAYVQQLRDGRHDFFAVFVRVLTDRRGESIEVDAGATSGDYLDGFLLGTRQALWEADRRSVTITLARLDEPALGGLIALFERAVGLYAELIDVNAYHQPGVEAGKRAAASVLDLQRRVLAVLGPEPKSAAEVARLAAADAADVWPILEHLAANRTAVSVAGASDPRTALFERR